MPYTYKATFKDQSLPGITSDILLITREPNELGYIAQLGHSIGNITLTRKRFQGRKSSDVEAAITKLAEAEGDDAHGELKIIKYSGTDVTNPIETITVPEASIIGILNTTEGSSMVQKLVFSVPNCTVGDSSFARSNESE